MNPVRGRTMLNFIDWLSHKHPEISSMSQLPVEKLVKLADEFEDGKLQHSDDLTRKWAIAFDYLLKDTGNWDGYNAIRTRYL